MQGERQLNSEKPTRNQSSIWLLSFLVSQNLCESYCWVAMLMCEFSYQVQKEKVQDYFGPHRNQGFTYLTTLQSGHQSKCRTVSIFRLTTHSWVLQKNRVLHDNHLMFILNVHYSLCKSFPDAKPSLFFIPPSGWWCLSGNFL